VIWFVELIFDVGYACIVACTQRFIYRMVITSDIWRETHSRNEEIMLMDLYLDLFLSVCILYQVLNPASNATYKQYY
jgi:hypothetical protein